MIKKLVGCAILILPAISFAVGQINFVSGFIIENSDLVTTGNNSNRTQRKDAYGLLLPQSSPSADDAPISVTSIPSKELTKEKELPVESNVIKTTSIDLIEKTITPKQ